ncbi:MAG: hypothetical protein ACYC63_05900 [Armatimonadota bacterium]
MPSPEAILDGLTDITNQWSQVAILWHVCLLLVVLALAIGRRPSRRRAATIAVLPLVSVSLAAWSFGNPFNGVVFVLLAIALLVVARQLPSVPVAAGPPWATAIGIVAIAFGWVYPHFLQNASPWLYLIAAPFGLLPCPTLSGLIGFTLLAGGFRSRSWSLTLSGAGLFYGLFGALRLGVQLDLALVGAAVALLVLDFAFKPEPTS